jgi:hypothetical protein
MAFESQADAANVGLKLVRHSKAAQFSANRGLVTEMFPFIFEASQRMSARAISRFLKDEQNITLSAVTITKALNNPAKSWNAFFDVIEPSARVIAMWMTSKKYSYLFLSRKEYEKITAPVTQSLVGRALVKWVNPLEVLPADKVLLEKWFAVSQETRLKARPYIEARIAHGV